MPDCECPDAPRELDRLFDSLRDAADGPVGAAASAINITDFFIWQASAVVTANYVSGADDYYLYRPGEGMVSYLATGWRVFVGEADAGWGSAMRCPQRTFSVKCTFQMFCQPHTGLTFASLTARQVVSRPQLATACPMFYLLPTHDRHCAGARRSQIILPRIHGGSTTSTICTSTTARLRRSPSTCSGRTSGPPQAGLAVGETVILLMLSLPLVGVSIVMERERQQNDRLADG